MKKEDQFQRNSQQQLEPSFEDADYQISMRQDKLTTTDEIRQELAENQRAQQERAKTAAQAAEAKAAERKKAELEAQIRSSIADESRADNLANN